MKCEGSPHIAAALRMSGVVLSVRDGAAVSTFQQIARDQHDLFHRERFLEGDVGARSELSAHRPGEQDMICAQHVADAAEEAVARNPKRGQVTTRTPMEREDLCSITTLPSAA